MKPNFSASAGFEWQRAQAWARCDQWTAEVVSVRGVTAWMSPWQSVQVAASVMPRARPWPWML